MNFGQVLTEYFLNFYSTSSLYLSVSLSQRFEHSQKAGARSPLIVPAQKREIAEGSGAGATEPRQAPKRQTVADVPAWSCSRD